MTICAAMTCATMLPDAGAPRFSGRRLLDAQNDLTEMLALAHYAVGTGDLRKRNHGVNRRP